MRPQGKVKRRLIVKFSPANTIPRECAPITDAMTLKVCPFSEAKPSKAPAQKASCSTSRFFAQVAYGIWLGLLSAGASTIITSQSSRFLMSIMVALWVCFGQLASTRTFIYTGKKWLRNCWIPEGQAFRCSLMYPPPGSAPSWTPCRDTCDASTSSMENGRFRPQFSTRTAETA